MLKEYTDLLKKAFMRRAVIKKALTTVSLRKIKDIDQSIHLLHDEVFETISCKDCGNCCRKLGPRINQTDIDRISTLLRMKRGDFIEKYLRIDEDNDFVFRTMPCKFLGDDNLCIIYDDRPRACRDYPHTREKHMAVRVKQLGDHVPFCPAAFKIAELIIKKYC